MGLNWLRGRGREAKRARAAHARSVPLERPHQASKVSVVGYDALAVMGDARRPALLRDLALLEAGPDHAFDRYTRLAARLVHAPTSVICVYHTEAPRVPSAFGIPPGWGRGREQALWRSLCAQVLTARVPLVIPDADASRELRSDPAHHALGVLAYVAVPVTVQGQPVGILGALDFQRHRWSEQDVQALRDLAATLGAELEQRLSTRTDQLRDLLDNASEMIASVDGDGRIAYVNEAAARALGRDRWELVGMRAAELVAREYAPAVTDAAARLLRDGDVRDFETELVTADGGRLRVKGSGSARMQDGSVVSARLIFRDARADFEAKMQLALAKRVAATVAKAATLELGLTQALEQLCGFGPWDRGDVWLRVGAQAGRPAGWLKTCTWALPGQNTGNLLSRERLTQVLGSGSLAEALPDGRSLAARLIMADDGCVGVLALAGPAPARDDGPAACLAAVAERIAPIIQKRRAQAELQDTKGRFQDFLANISDMVMSVAADGRVSFTNRAWKQTLGYDEGSVAGLHLDDLLHPAVRERCLGVIARIFQGESIPDLEATLLARHGEAVDVEGSGTPRFEGGVVIAARLNLRNVTARRRAEHALRERERQLAAAQKLARLGSWERDLRTGALRWSDELYAIYGVATGTPVTLDLFLSSVHPHDRERVRGILEAAEARIGPFSFEAEIARPDWSTGYVFARGDVYPDAEGRPARMVGITLDVSDQRQAEERLRRDAEMLDLANDAIVIHAPDGEIRYWNRGAERLYGFTREEATGRRIDELLQTQYPDGIELVRRGVAEDSRWAGELIHARKDGSEITVDSRWTVLREQGIDEAILEINDDVTERKRMQELFGAVLDAATEYCIVGTDPNGLITAFNAGAERMLGYTAREVVGATTPALFHDGDEVEAWAGELGVEPTLELLVGAAREGRAETREWTYLRKDGSRFPVSLTVTAMKDNHGRITGLLWMAVDVTRRREEEEALRRARDDAEAAARMKSEFLANMSHEIRTPMNGIMGMTELLLQTGPTHEQQEYLEMARASAESLLRIVDDILDFSRIEAGKLALEPHPFALRATMGETLKTLSVRAREKGIELSFLVSPLVPDALVGDAGRLRQVLVNLVSNAIKFTDRGEVEVTVRAEEDDQPGLLLHVTVRDTGIGIAPHRLPAIFEPFVQADASTTRRFGGTGLGLSISSQLVSLMGGRIDVVSEPGRGSTFHFTARLQRGFQVETVERGAGEPAASTPAASPEPAATRPALHVLLAEDNAVNQRVAAVMLEKQGHRVTLAGNGREAVERSEREAFDLILMDVQMPELGGLEAAQRIRERERQLGGHVPIVALTAHARATDRERCLAAGMDAYLAKPVRCQELVALIDELRPAAADDPPRDAIASGEQPAPEGAPALDGVDWTEPPLRQAACM